LWRSDVKLVLAGFGSAAYIGAATGFCGGFCECGLGDRDGKDVIGSPYLGQEALFAGTLQRDFRLIAGHGLDIARESKNCGAGVYATDGKLVQVVIAEPRDAISAGGKSLAADDEIVRNIYHEPIGFACLRSDSERSNKERHHEHAEIIPFHYLSPFLVWSGQRYAPFAAGLKKTAVSIVLRMQPQTCMSIRRRNGNPR